MSCITVFCGKYFDIIHDLHLNSSMKMGLNNISLQALFTFLFFKIVYSTSNKLALFFFSMHV